MDYPQKAQWVVDSKMNIRILCFLEEIILSNEEIRLITKLQLEHH